jgi:endoglucanase
MFDRSPRRRLLTATTTAAATVALVVLAAVTPATAATPGPTPPLVPGAQLFVDPASTTVQAAATLTGDAKDDALLLAQFPTATWFTKGTPSQVEASARATVQAAQSRGAVPVLVAYYLPNRDCGQYSAGGAQSTAQYEAWIDGLARGIGQAPAAVILEPDGLGLIPNYVSRIDGSSNCSIPGVDPANRFVELNYAVDKLKASSHTAVYLDATHTGWQNVGESAQRLLMAGVQRANGFFLNASNYQLTANQVAYGRWVSSCIALAERDSAADPTAYDFGGQCGNQYWNGGPATSWNGTGMDTTQSWRNEPFSGNAADLAWNTVGIDSRYANALGTTTPTTHFVIDTSRNGQGPWTGGGAYPDRQDWCNPPGRGLGVAPTTSTGNPLVDAFLWIKVPGESDGQCTRGTGGSTDPEWGGVADPAAGAWFAAQADELIRLAVPAVAQPCRVAYTVHSSWPGGFTTQVWLTNTGTRALNGWNVRWAFPKGEKVAQIWSAASSQSGATVQAANLSYNQIVKPGETMTFGFNGTIASGKPGTPTSFAVNGVTCTG